MHESDPRAEPTVGISFREATAADNAQLLELSRACHMEGDISLSIEREPDFFALTRARGSGRTVVGLQNGRIVCCGSVCRRKAYLFGRPATMGYLGDVKVAPELRRQKLAQRLLDDMLEVEEELEPVPYIGLTAVGNVSVDELGLRFGKRRALHRLATFTSHQLLPIVPLPVSRELELRTAISADHAELVTLLDAYHQSRTFAPVFRDGGLEEILARSPGMGLDSYRIARRQRQIVAAVAIWEEGAIKRTRVVQMTRNLRWLSGGLAALRRALPLPPFPAEGDLLRFSYLRHPAHAPGELPALTALVRQALNESRERDEHFLLFNCADGDPIRQCVRGIPRTKFRYQLTVGSNRPELDELLPQYRNTLPFDDAALA